MKGSGALPNWVAAWSTLPASRRQRSPPLPGAQLLASFPPGPPTGAVAELELLCEKPVKRLPHLDVVRGAGELAETSGLRKPPRSRW